MQTGTWLNVVTKLCEGDGVLHAINCLCCSVLFDSASLIL